jgi:hypothetical protein
LFTLLDAGSFLKVLKIAGKSLARPAGVFFHAAKSSQMPYGAKQNEIYNFDNQIKKSL